MTARFYISILIAVFVGGCTSLEMDPQHADVPVWTTEGETSQRMNAVPNRIPPPLQQVWDFNAGAGFGSVSPIIVGDVIFVATRKGEVHAIDMDSGNRIGQGQFGDSIEGTPVYVDGTLIVPLAWGGVALHAHNLHDGGRKWRVKGAPVTAGLLAYNGSIIAGDVEGMVRAYSATTGDELWERQLGDRSSILSTPVAVGEHIVVADDDGLVAALNPEDGSLIWSAEAGAPVQVSLAADDGSIYAATTRGLLTAFDADSGAEKWSYDLFNDDVYLTPPAVGEWEIVVGGSDGTVRALDKSDGLMIWSIDLSAAVAAPPVITDHVVYIGTMGGELHGLSREDGASMWSTELEGRIKSAFAVKGNRLVVQAEPRLVHLFEPSTEPYATREE